MFARICIMRALNRRVERAFDPVAEGQASGTPEVGARSMTNACNYRGFDPDRLRTPAASCGTLSAKQEPIMQLQSTLTCPKMQLSGCRDNADRCLPVLL